MEHSMERVRVWAVGDRLYPHPGGHVPGRHCRFIGRTHKRVEIDPKPDLSQHPHADTHRAEFPAVLEGELILVGDITQGAEMMPSDLHRAILHGDLTDKDPNAGAQASDVAERHVDALKGDAAETTNRDHGA